MSSSRSSTSYTHAWSRTSQRWRGRRLSVRGGGISLIITPLYFSLFISCLYLNLLLCYCHLFLVVVCCGCLAEWWAHTRPHSCGHQFHFDSDETALCAGQHAQHPIATAILYLSPAEDGDENSIIGGPTIVTNQTLQSEYLASEGFMFLPKENRMVAFDARYLHGNAAMCVMMMQAHDSRMLVRVCVVGQVWSLVEVCARLLLIDAACPSWWAFGRRSRPRLWRMGAQERVSHILLHGFIREVVLLMTKGPFMFAIHGHRK